jgi:hypothetical protein
VCSFFEGERANGASNRVFSPRPLSDFPGDRGFKDNPSFPPVSTRISLPSRCFQDVRMMFVILGTVLSDGGGCPKTHYSAKLSDLRLWFTPYHIEEEGLFVAPILDQIVVGMDLLNRLCLPLSSKMIRYFRKQPFYCLAVQWLSDLCSTLDLHIEADATETFARMVKSLYMPFVSHVFPDALAPLPPTDDVPSLLSLAQRQIKAGNYPLYLSGMVVVSFPNIHQPSSLWTRVIIHPSLRYLVEGTGHYDVRFFSLRSLEGKVPDFDDAYDPFGSYYLISRIEGEWMERRYRADHFNPQVQREVRVVLDYLNTDLF